MSKRLLKRATAVSSSSLNATTLEDFFVGTLNRFRLTAEEKGEVVDWGSLEFTIDEEHIDNRTLGGDSGYGLGIYFDLRMSVYCLGGDDE